VLAYGVSVTGCAFEVWDQPGHPENKLQVILRGVPAARQPPYSAEKGLGWPGDRDVCAGAWGTELAGAFLAGHRTRPCFRRGPWPLARRKPRPAPRRWGRSAHVDGRSGLLCIDKTEPNILGTGMQSLLSAGSATSRSPVDRKRVQAGIWPGFCAAVGAALGLSPGCGGYRGGS